MDQSALKITPHPKLRDYLFSFKNRVTPIFNDILGLHELHHLSFTYVTQAQQLLIFSSNPALEYNLFSGTLWQKDQTYQPHWYHQKTEATWPSLYDPQWVQQLTQVKQKTYFFEHTLCFSETYEENTVICAMATRESTSILGTLSPEHILAFKKISLYCMQQLLPLFKHEDHAYDKEA